MESRFSRHGCTYSFQAITIVVILVGILSGHAGADGGPSIGNPEMTPSESQGDPCSDSPLCQLRQGDFKVGIFWGDGSMNVHRNIAPGPATYLTIIGPTFAGFKHRTDTSLNDTFLAIQEGFRWGDMLVATTSLDTNIGRQNQFKQTSSASPGQSLPSYNTTLGTVLFLPDNTNGVITLEDKNRILNLDQCFAFRVKPKLQFLVGWKYSEISSNLSPYSATVPPNTWRSPPGITGWENYWTDSTLPSTLAFTMTQELWWTGPYLGMRLTEGAPQKLPGQLYIEGKAVPYAWGNYTFDWNGYYGDPYLNGAAGISGQQSTHVTGLHGYMLEVKGGTQIELIENLYLDVWAKYMHLNMNGSGYEVQSHQNRYTSIIPAFWPSPFSQEAAENIAINENFWGAGVSLVLHF